jgi:hypothetical protein
MSIQPDTAVGVLRVDMEEPSNFLRTSLPFVVRDAHHAVVHRGTCGSSTRLPAGLYSVAVVTPDGERASQPAQIRPAETTSLAFKSLDAIGEPSGGPEVPGPGPGPPPPATPPALLSTHRCSVSLADQTGWEFVPTDRLDAVPSAVFMVEERRLEMSLPLNPVGGYPLTSCRVNIVTAGGRLGLRMAFAAGRRVSRLVDGLARHPELAAGSGVLEEATKLLYMKYTDPPGAALGGLTLHRLGLLQQRREWVGNLARDFPWLTDGLVLAAALWRHEPNLGDQQRALNLLLTAAQQRPMYTDGLSLAMELLRRWPSDSRKDERYTALDRLADYSAYADWDSVNLSIELPGREPP